MPITLTPAMEARVYAFMEDRQVSSPGEILELALQSLLSEEERYAEKKAAFNEELGRRIESMNRGEGISMEEYRIHLDAKIASWREKCL